MVGRYTTRRWRSFNNHCGPKSIARLNEERAKRTEYSARKERLLNERDVEARRIAAQEGEVIREVIAANKPIARAPDKRKSISMRGKKIKTRTRRAAQRLRLTRTKKATRKKA